MRKLKFFTFFVSLSIFLFAYLFISQSKAYALTASITSSASSTAVGQPTLTFTVDGAGSHFKKMEVWAETAAGTDPYPYWCPGTKSGKWCKLGEVNAPVPTPTSGPWTSSLSGTISWTPRNGGSYIVVVNAFDYWGSGYANWCSGDPSITNTNPSNGIVSCGNSDNVTVSAINGPPFTINQLNCNLFQVTFSGGTANSNVHLYYVLPTWFNSDLVNNYSLKELDVSLDGSGNRVVELWPHDGLSIDAKRVFFDGVHDRKVSVWASYGSSIAWDTSNLVGHDSGNIGVCNPNLAPPTGEFSASCDRFWGTASDTDWPNHSVMVDHWLTAGNNPNPNPAFLSTNEYFSQTENTATNDRVYLGEACNTDQKDDQNRYVNAHGNGYMCDSLGDIQQPPNRGYSRYPRLEFTDTGRIQNPWQPGYYETWYQVTDFFTGTPRNVSAYAIGFKVWGERSQDFKLTTTNNSCGASSNQDCKFYTLTCYPNLRITNISQSPQNPKVNDDIIYSFTYTGGKPTYNWSLQHEVNLAWPLIASQNDTNLTTVTATKSFSTAGTKNLSFRVDSKPETGTTGQTAIQPFNTTVCVSNVDEACTSSPNNCGTTNSGTINCGGSCSASPPADATCPTSTPTNTPIPPTPTPTTAPTLGSLVIAANTGDSPPAVTGIVRKSGLRSTQGGGNIYNSLTITQNVTGSTGAISLVGVAFTSPASAPANNTLYELTRSAYAGKGFVLISVGSQNKTVNYCNPPLVSGVCPTASKTFAADKYYVYFNGAWGDDIGALANGWSDLGTNINVKINSTSSLTTPKFDVTLYKNLQTRNWGTYRYLMKSDNSEVSQSTTPLSSSIPLAQAPTENINVLGAITSEFNKFLSFLLK